MDLKILQIIPAPEELRAVYRQDDGTDSFSKILCLALVEDDEGAASVRLMVTCSDGKIGFCEDFSNFSEVEF